MRMHCGGGEGGDRGSPHARATHATLAPPGLSWGPFADAPKPTSPKAPTPGNVSDVGWTDIRRNFAHATTHMVYDATMTQT